jgi:hypothetical protein
VFFERKILYLDSKGWKLSDKITENLNLIGDHVFGANDFTILSKLNGLHGMP